MQPLLIGQRLKIARVVKGLSAKDLAARVGVSSAYLSQLERGKRTHPSPALLEKLASELALDAAEIGAVLPELPVLGSAGAGYISAAELERALDAARAARDWKAVAQLAADLAVKEGK